MQPEVQVAPWTIYNLKNNDKDPPKLKWYKTENDLKSFTCSHSVVEILWKKTWKSSRTCICFACLTFSITIFFFIEFLHYNDIKSASNNNNNYYLFILKPKHGNKIVVL